MEIKRIKKEVINLHKKDKKEYNFLSTEKFIDTIELDECLFTHYYKKYSKSENDVFATDDFIKVEFESDKDIIEKNIKLDNIEYVFYLASASDLKKSTAMFIKRELADTLGTDLIKHTTGNITTRLEGKDVVINKIQAYISLMFSGAIKTNLKPNVVIIEELKYKYKGLHTILKDIDTLEFAEEEIETELKSHDGQGIISKEFAEKIRAELNSKRAENKQLKYIDWITFRLYTVGSKGMCTTVDIKEELKRIWNKYGDSEGLKKIEGKLYIRDIYNQWHDVNDVDMILNESQTKLIKYFESNEDIETAKEGIPDDYKDIVNSLYICKHNENNLRTDRTKLNYQFSQALALTYKDLLELTKDEQIMLEQSLTDIDAMLIINQLAEIKDMNEKSEEDTSSINSFNLALDLVKYDNSFLKDKTVLEQIRRLYMSKIKQLCYGRVFMKNMAYRIMIQDPQVYLNFIATRDMKTARDSECLQAKEICVVGRPENQKNVIGRNPLSSHQEMIKFENTRNGFIDSLRYKSNSIVVLNSYDATSSRMSGADFDGDTCAVIVDDIIYNSVIELDTPTFFNTFDGMIVKNKYTRENIIEMTKIASGDKIGNLALINTGLMNKCNDIPLFDYRINKEIYSRDLFYIERDKINKAYTTLENSDCKIELNQETNKAIEQLYKEGKIVNGLSVMTEEQIKSYIKRQHKQHRYEQYLILFAQQCAIDCSKTGIDIPKNVKEKIKQFSEKPSFLRYTGKNRDKGNTFRNSVLDVFSHKIFLKFNTKRMELLEDIEVSLNKDLTKAKSSETFKNKNVILDLFKNASKDANTIRVSALVKHIKPIVNEYSKNLREVRIKIEEDKKKELSRQGRVDMNYYQSMYETLSNNFKMFFRDCYNNCESNVNNFTVEDLSKAIVEIKMKEKYILEFLPKLLIYNVGKMNSKKKVFIKGNLNNGSKVITLGNKEYTLIYKDIKKDEIESTVYAHSLQELKKKSMNEGSMIQLKSHFGIKFNLDQKLILKRKADNKFLFQAINEEGAILDEVRLSVGSKEFNEDIDELTIIIDSFKCESKTKKYEYWFIKRCA